MQKPSAAVEKYRGWKLVIIWFGLIVGSWASVIVFAAVARSVLA